MQKRTTNIWGVVPAAGIGTRMQSEVPKQYLPLHGQTVIEHTLSRLNRHPAVSGVMVALAAHDQHWHALPVEVTGQVLTTIGGKERSDSVLAALDALAEHAGEHDWVLVHDAARPCIRQDDIDKLVNTLASHDTGGLLALPVRDTMKRSDQQGQVTETVNREHLWHALTPQMFRLGPLLRALQEARASGRKVTDEAQAMELSGHIPQLVEGHADNIKITRPQDLALAALYLQQQED